MSVLSKKGPLPATTEYILQLLSEGHSREDIEQRLLAEGYDLYFIRDMLSETIRLRDAKNRSRALVLIIAGGVLCMAGFFITLVLSYSDSGSDIILYGLTSAGIILTFIGFTKIF